MTRPRRDTAKDHVFRALRSAGVATSAYEILDAVRPLGISAPIIVYRALNLLIEEGLAYRLESTNAYVARAVPSRGAGFPTLAICSDCHAVEELFDDTILHHLHAFAKRHGFEIKNKAIEINVRCRLCRAAAPRNS